MADIYVATTGNDTTGTGAVGTPYATPGKAGSVMVAGDTVFIKSGTYTLTNSVVNTAGGPVRITFTDETNITRIVGYDTNATIDNTDANRPVLDAGAQTNLVLFECSGYGAEVRNVVADGNAQTGTTGFYNSGGYSCPFIQCKAVDCTSYGFRSLSSLVGLAFACEAVGCSGTASFHNLGCYGCVARGGTCVGFTVTIGGYMFGITNCLAYGNTGASTDGFDISSSSGGQAVVSGCVSYGNGRHGFHCTQYARNSALVNCVAVGNGASGTGYGFVTSATGGKVVHLRNCAGYNNATGNQSLAVATQSTGFVTLTGDPFTNAASGDFSTNSTAGAGAALRGAGYPGTYPGGTTTGYPDIGVQHQDSGGPGGGGGSVFGGGVVR